MEKLIKSPFWAIVSILILGIFMVSRLEEYEEYNLLTNLADILILLAIPIGLCYILMIFVYNKKHPNQKINVNNWIPIEFREEDEGMKWLTFKACRKVYMFFSLALPLSLIVILIFPNIRVIPIIIVILLTAMQYIIYWSVIRKANIKEEE